LTTSWSLFPTRARPQFGPRCSRRCSPGPGRRSSTWCSPKPPLLPPRPSRSRPQPLSPSPSCGLRLLSPRHLPRSPRPTRRLRSRPHPNLPVPLCLSVQPRQLRLRQPLSVPLPLPARRSHLWRPALGAAILRLSQAPPTSRAPRVPLPQAPPSSRVRRVLPRRLAHWRRSLRARLLLPRLPVQLPLRYLLPQL